MHFAQLRERIELDDHSIAPQSRIDGEEQAVDTDVGRILVDLAEHPLVKEAEHRAQIDLADYPGILAIAIVGRLSGLAMDLAVISRLEPGREHLVQLVEGEDVAGTDFGFQLALAGLKEPLDQTAGGRISWGPVKELDIQLSAGQLEGIGMILALST